MEALRQILAVFKTDMVPLKKGVKEGNTAVDGFKSTLKSLAGPMLAAFSGAAIISWTKEIIQGADATAKLSDALGMGIVELQGWQHAADLSGIKTEMLSMSLGKVQLQLNEASTKGTGPAAEALKVLGIEAENADGKLKSTGQVVEEVADAIQGMDATERNAQLMKLFGEQGAKLVPLLKGGSEGIRAMRQEVEDLGFAFDEEFARGAEAFDDNLDRLHKGLKGFMIQAIGPLLPDMLELTSSMVRGAKAAIPMVRGFVSWLRETKLLQAALAMLSGKGLLLVIRGVGSWMKSLGGLRGILMRVLPLIWKLIAPLLILEDLFVFLAGGESALGKTLDKVFGKGTANKVREIAHQAGKFFTLFKTAPGEIRAAFSRLPQDLEASMGGFGEFMGELGQNLIEYFLFVTSALTGGWENFGNKAEAVGQWLLAAINIIWTEIKFAGLGVAAALGDAFVEAWNGIISGAQRALGAIAEVMSRLPFLDGAADAAKGAAQGLEGLKGDANQSAKVQEQAHAASMAIVADIEAATAKAYRSSGSSQNISQDVTNTTQVNVTVPPGTPASAANRVGQAARQGAEQGTRRNLRATQDALVQGSRRNLRATQDALVPRPAG